MSESDAGRTISRGLSLLRILMRAGPDGLRLSQLSREADLPKATVHRLLATLVGEGFAAVQDGAYVVGPEAQLFGLAGLQGMSLGLGAMQSLDRIARETGDVALLSLRIGAFAHIAGRIEGDYPILPMSLKPGARRPLGCGAHALAILADLSDDEVGAMLVANAKDRAAYENFDDTRLWELVRKTREQHFAESDGDIIEGMSAVAVSIRDGDGRPVASLSCAAISSRLLADRRPRVIDLIREEAARHDGRFRTGVPSAGTTTASQPNRNPGGRS